MRKAAQRGLYDPDRESPALNGSRCSACGQVSFPPLSLGCEVCGADESRLERIALAARGRVHSLATVHLHHGRPPAPFTVAEIHLDDGPLVRAMVDASGPPLSIGARAEAAWVVTATDSDGNETVEPGFRGIEAAS